MSDFGFNDPHVMAAILRTYRDNQQQDAQTQQAQNQAQYLQTENQAKQASLADMLYQQGRQRSLADLVSSGTPYAQALTQTGYGQEALDAQAAALRQQEAFYKLHHTIITSQAGAVGDDPEKAARFLATLQPESRQAYGVTGDEQGDEALAAVKGIRNTEISPYQQAELENMRLHNLALQKYYEQRGENQAENLGLQRQRLTRGDVGVNPVTGAYFNKHGGAGPGVQAPAKPAPDDGGGSQAPSGDAADVNPLAGLKPKEIEAKWKDFRDAISTVKGRGNLNKDQQERLNSAERLEALVLGPGGQIQNLTPQQVREAGTALANLISKGSMSLGQIEELTPHTLAAQFANLKQKLLNAPEGADAQAFLQNMLETAAREKAVTLKQLQAGQLQAVPDFMGLRKLDKGRFERDLRGARLDPSLIDENGLQTKGAGGPALERRVLPDGRILEKGADGVVRLVNG